MTLHNPISVFTPSRSNPEDLEAIMVQRHDLLTDAVERIEESASTDNKHHLLFVGPRGTGKTHLMTLLVHRLSTTPNLRVAWLNEDETSTTLIEFLLRIYTALQKRYPLDFSADDVDPIYDLPPADAERELIQVLLEKLQSKSLLVVVENLDALFEGLGKEGQQKLRAFIQEHPVLSIVATAQRLVEGISKRSNAFFGFFQIENLKPLTVEEAAELLSNIAHHREEQELADFILTPVGLSRIRALHHLSGGNHRIYIVLSQFITSKTIDLLVEPFAKMIDEMTPYYQERIRWLPPQQRKIVEFLCNVDRPATVKQIARRLFTSNQTISSQLKDLRGKGYVQAGQRGRESLYEITEPLMRICVEVKENQNSEPLKILVDFLRVWYDGVELSSLLEGCESSNAEYAYLMSAISKNEEQGNLRVELLVDSFRGYVGLKETDEVEELHAIKNIASVHDGLGLGYGKWASGQKEEGIVLIQEIANNTDINTEVRAFAFQCLSLFYIEAFNYEQALEVLNVALDLPLDVGSMEASLVERRADCYIYLGRNEEAVIELSSLILRDDISERYKHEYIYKRSLGYSELECIDLQIKDLTFLINNTPKTSVDFLRKYYFYRGSAYLIIEDREGGKKDFEEIIRIGSGKKCTKEEFGIFVLCALIAMQNSNWAESFSILKAALEKALSSKLEYRMFIPIVVKHLFGYAKEMVGIEREVLVQGLLKVYMDNSLILELVEELIAHLGILLREGGCLPENEILEGWATEWEAALSSYPEVSISLRIFRTGIEFLKAGGEDRSVLLSLHQEERRILEQVFQLED